jgi:hypothetical protein
MKARVSTSGISFGDLSPADERNFFNTLEQFEKKVLNAFKATGVENADEIFNTSLNLGEILRAIPKQTRDGLLREYQNIIGFRQMSSLLDKNTGGAFTEFSTADTGKKLRRFNIDLNQSPGASGKLNPLAVIYNRATISENYLTGEPDMGSNIIKSSHLRSLIERKPLESGKNIFVFDTETASLGTGNIREVAAFETVTSTVDGKVIVESPTNVAFHKNLKTTQMRLGSLYDEKTRAVSTMEEVLQKQLGFNFVEGSPQEGAEFVKVMKDFLTRMNNADHIVGQNLQFDIVQIFQGIKNTNAYKADASLRNIVKQSEAKLNTKGVVIDTLEIARQKLNINLAPELSLKGAVSTHSLDNMLLETNLVELMIDDIGGNEDDLLDLLMGKKSFGGVHGAAVDTRIETYLFKFLMEDKLEASPSDGQRSIDKHPAVKKVLQQSYAPTPVTNIANLGHISPRVLDRMAQVGGIRVMREGQAVDILGQDEYSGLRGDKLRAKLTAESEDVFYKMTPIQQQMLEQRNMGMLGRATGQIAGRTSFGRSQGFSQFAQADVKNKGFMNADGTLRIGAEMPSMEAYNTFQRAAAESGDVLAGLSLPERMMTEGMRRASLLDEGIAGIESTGASLIENLGISYFRSTQSPFVSSANGMVSLPPALMRHLEVATVGDNAQTVLQGTNFAGVEAKGKELQSIRVSAFQTKQGEYRAQAAVDIGEENLRRVSNYFNQLTQQQFDELPMEVRQLIGTRAQAAEIGQGALRMLGSDVPKAISIGELTGKAAETAHNVMAPFMNSQQIMSDMTEMTFTSSLIDANENTIRLSAFTGRDFMTEGERTLIDDVARQTAKQRATVVDGVLAGDYKAEEAATRIRRSLGKAGQAVSETQAFRALETAQAVKTVTSKLPIAAGLVATAFAGKKVFESLQERQEIDETFDFQGYETGTDYYNLEQQVQAATIRRQRRLDPLATAGLTANMHNARGNHMLMGPNSNAHLFNGVML